MKKLTLLTFQVDALQKSGLITTIVEGEHVVAPSTVQVSGGDKPLKAHVRLARFATVGELEAYFFHQSGFGKTEPEHVAEKREEFLQEMRALYPNLTLDSPVTVLLVRPAADET